MLAAFPVHIQTCLPCQLATFAILLLYPLPAMLICTPVRACFQKYAIFGSCVLTKYHQTEGTINYMCTG
jgi:hypothetical protein